METEMKIVKTLRPSYVSGGILYIPTDLKPEKYLRLGEPIKIVDIKNKKIYSKEWGCSDNRYFIYGMKEVYNSHGGERISNCDVAFFWNEQDHALCLDISNTNTTAIPIVSTKDFRAGSVIMKVLNRVDYQEERDVLTTMPSMYILLEALSSASNFYVGYSLNMYQRLNTHNNRPPHNFNWRTAIIFVHEDGKHLFVEEAMRLEYKALSSIREQSIRLVNRKRAIQFNYSPETIKTTDEMFVDIKYLIDKQLKLKIFQ